MILTLKNDAELRDSRAFLRSRHLDFTDPRRNRFWRWLYRCRYRLPLPAADPMKSWDVANAVRVLEQAVPDRETPVLDMGCFNSEVLYCLRALGYRRLHGCDLNPMCRWMPHWNQISYDCADLTRTPYPDGMFGAITCVSVIEHGVPIDGLIAEVVRLLRPGGVFLFTTDYDATAQDHAIDAGFRVFGQSWRIFSPDEVAELIGKFAAAGLSLLDPARDDRSHNERPVRWNGQEYTFTLVALRKAG